MASQTEKTALPDGIENQQNADPPPYTEVPPANNRDENLASNPAQVIIGVPLGSKPMFLTCPRCNTEITTIIKLRVSSRTHLIAGIVCIAGGLICAWIPYVLDCAKAKDHFCPNCDQFIGTGKR